MGQRTANLNKARLKLGDARRMAKRIWIEGARLRFAGFEPGSMYTREWDRVNGVVVLELVKRSQNDVIFSMPYKVSSKGRTPIVDIVGEDIRIEFDGSTHVDVTFEQGKVTIQAAKGGAQ